MAFTKSLDVFPLELAIKHEPPTIALLYKKSANANKKYMYSILLNGLIALEDP